ncbi:hypothetical protein D3C86_1224090 [compost metagenome]
MLRQPLDQPCSRNLRSTFRRIGQHRRPQALQIAVLVIDGGDLVIFLEQQFGMVDDGDGENAFPERRLGLIAPDKARLRQAIGNAAGWCCHRPATPWRIALEATSRGLRTIAAEIAVLCPALLKTWLEKAIQPVTHILLVKPPHGLVADHGNNLPQPAFELGAFFRRIEGDA